MATKQRVKKIVLDFGPLSESFKNQLNEQRLNFEFYKVQIFEGMKDAINLLYKQGLIIDSQKERLTKKLYFKIGRHVAKYEKMIVKK